MLFLVQYSMHWPAGSPQHLPPLSYPASWHAETKLVCNAPAVPEGSSAVSPLWCWCWFLWEFALSRKTEGVAHMVSCRNSAAISGHPVCVQNGMLSTQLFRLMEIKWPLCPPIFWNWSYLHTIDISKQITECLLCCINDSFESRSNEFKGSFSLSPSLDWNKKVQGKIFSKKSMLTS